MKKWFSNFKQIFQDKEKRSVILSRYRRLENISTSQFIFGSVSFYGLFTLIYYYQNDDDFKLKFSISRNLSRLTGYIAQIPVPQTLRKPLFNYYSKQYNVVTDDIVKDFDEFKNFQEFFTREVKKRNISQTQNEILSPADSKILSICEVTQDQTLLIKNRYYSVGELLTGIKNYEIKGDIMDSMKKKQTDKNPTKIYQCIFYLNPGDYHRFHSPCELLIKRRNHISGYLAPVKESYILENERVYEQNERVSIFGEYFQGFISMVFVGALNVGSIDLNFDNDLKTNCSNTSVNKFKVHQYFKNQNQNPKKLLLDNSDMVEFDQIEQSEQNIQTNKEQLQGWFKQLQNGIYIPKGVEIGKFNLGSTIVMFFEINNQAQILVDNGQFVRYGQPIVKFNE